ncbi:tRNA (guanosine(18)-2'-O)-methyltransferase TrmH [Aquisalimonas asiatica]|uniref:tRNA (guanosine(18)-2'-O)-methyltransferase n=1 Tax=Aquisalimonas asiatica TaxID=406100 RepID=A0A1H8R1L2_9GAMM|nr:tRNA (guanosine(18)-2'-O)-methyltransferase TrmH [Aquisalimonas asiatica]SEO60167.1 tRNA (guanosine-2'-O-)-methyltransferase [Aquisalimonas asiatica]
MSASRLQRIQQVLNQRQPDLTAVMAGVHKEHNVSAVMRTCDAVGAWEIHSVGQDGRLVIKRTAAAGVQRWVRLHQHPDVAEGCRALRDRGFQLVAAHLCDEAVDFREVDYTRPTALVLGREKLGVPEAALAQVDTAIRIPMAGFTDSLNVSVAAAVVLYEAQRQRLEAGLYDQRRLDDETYRRTLFEWVQPKIARYCRQRGLRYPELDDEGHVVGGIEALQGVDAS